MVWTSNGCTCTSVSFHIVILAGHFVMFRLVEGVLPNFSPLHHRRLSIKHKDCPLQIVVNMDGCVRFSTLLQAAATPTSLSSSVSSMTGEALEDGTVVLPWIRPVLLLLPTRFGLDRVTESYRGNLKRLFRMPQFLGIAGGRPGRSLYFVASQGKEMKKNGW